jgi:hypothetical protein
VTKPPSRRAFLKNGAGALPAGGVLINARLAEAADGPLPVGASAAAGGAFEPAEMNVPQARYPLHG